MSNQDNNGQTQSEVKIHDKAQPNQENSDHAQNSSNDQVIDASIAIGIGTALGTGVSSVVGGMGLVVAGTGASIGAAPIVAGAVLGAAAHGAKKAVEEQDPTAIGAAVVGAGLGAGASAIVGGMGLAVAGTAIGVTMAPVAAMGAVIGLAGYGISKLFSE